jgi:2-polyprenyl-3-methyl-5-hydroxy-6-metoxy-1,4-benzoquinol methylase
MVVNSLITYNKAVDQKRLEFIITHLKNCIPDKGSILDVGCGNGIISMKLGELGYQVQGIDISEKAISKAKQINLLENVKFDVVSAEELTASGKTYDAIICSEVLEHLSEPAVLLKTLFNILKNNGKLIVTVPNGRGPREMLVTRPMLKLRSKNNWAWNGISGLKRVMGYQGVTIQSDADNLDHVQFFTKNELYLLSKKNDFVITAFNNTNFVEDIFPFSLVTKRINYLQKLDCKLADILPHHFTGGFNMVWIKSPVCEE